MNDIPSKEKKTYSIDLKIYEKANIYEVPFPLPEKMSDSQSIFKLGYHNIVVHWEPSLVDEFYTWCSSNGTIMKIIGSEKID
jgi:hypothetical protein